MMRKSMLIFVAAAMVAASVAGCSEYVERREGIGRVAGDAVRANIAAHVIDPWPANAHNRRILIDAERQVARAEAFNTGAMAPLRRGNSVVAEIESESR